MDWIHMQVDSEAARTPLPLDVLVPDAETEGSSTRQYFCCMIWRAITLRGCGAFRWRGIWERWERYS